MTDILQRIFDTSKIKDKYPEFYSDSRLVKYSTPLIGYPLSIQCELCQQFYVERIKVDEPRHEDYVGLGVMCNYIVDENPETFKDYKETYDEY